MCRKVLIPNLVKIMVSSIPVSSEPQKKRGNDPISWYLSNIGRVPLLTPAEEIELGNQVQKMMLLTEDGQVNEKNKEFTLQQKRSIKIGRRAKERMMKANLRLVVSVAKKYQGKGLELLDLVQEGSLGLEGQWRNLIQQEVINFLHMLFGGFVKA